MKLLKIIIPILLILSFRIDSDSQELQKERIEYSKLKLNDKISIEYLTKLFGLDSNCYLLYIPHTYYKEVLITKIINDDMKITYAILLDEKDTIIFKRPFNGDTIKNLKKDFLQALYKIKSDEVTCIFEDSIFNSVFSK